MLLSLLTIVDNGGGAYNETPFILRYSIYVVVFVRLLLNIKILTHKYLMFWAWGFLLIILSMFRVEELDLNTLQNNFIILFCIFVALTSGEDIKLKISDLVYPLLFYGFGELINIYLNVIKIEDYLNYNTLKYIIAVPALVLLIKRKYVELIICTPITLLILIYYGSRMASLIFIVSIGLGIVSILKSKANIIVVLIACLFIWYTQGLIDQNGVEDSIWDTFKFGRFVYNILTSFNSLELLEKIDPVRLQEHKLFFNRNYIEILFGSGVGVGLRDVNGYLDVVGYYNTAFSDKELETKVFHRFHDLWIDFSLRFGLIAFLVGLVKTLKNVYSSDEKIKMKSLLILGFSFTGFYSIAGILMVTFIFVSDFELYEHNKKN